MFVVTLGIWIMHLQMDLFKQFYAFIWDFRNPSQQRCVIAVVWITLQNFLQHLDRASDEDQ